MRVKPRMHARKLPSGRIGRQMLGRRYCLSAFIFFAYILSNMGPHITYREGMQAHNASLS